MGKLGTNRWRYFTGSIQELHDAVGAEIYHAEQSHRKYNSWHEAFAVLQEEVDEFWDGVKADDPDPHELIQVAAVALRAIADLVPAQHEEKNAEMQEGREPKSDDLTWQECSLCGGSGTDGQAGLCANCEGEGGYHVAEDVEGTEQGMTQ
jgi:hypothetical protein